MVAMLIGDAKGRGAFHNHHIIHWRALSTGDARSNDHDKREVPRNAQILGNSSVPWAPSASKTGFSCLGHICVKLRHIVCD
jgi:hypothetical protein